MIIKLEIPNDPQCINAARAFFDILAGGTAAPVVDQAEQRAHREPATAAPDPATATVVKFAEAMAEPDPATAAAQQATPPAAGAGPATDQPAEDEWPQTINGVLFDKAGMPWDERIHAGTKNCKKDGNWKYLRGVQPITVEEVEAELKAAMAAPAPDPATAAAAPAAMPVATPPEQTPPPAAAPAVQVTDFPSLMAALTPKFQDGSVTMERVTEVCVELGIQQLALAATRPDLCPTIAEKLGL